MSHEVQQVELRATCRGDRFNEHRRPVDNQSNISKPSVVSEHFLSNDHTASDMQLIPLELVKTKQEKHILLREVRPLNL